MIALCPVPLFAALASCDDALPVASINDLYRLRDPSNRSVLVPWRSEVLEKQIFQGGWKSLEVELEHLYRASGFCGNLLPQSGFESILYGKVICS